MEAHPDDILQAALRLAPAAREALLSLLIDSLDAEQDDEAEAAWRAEIGRRVQAIQAEEEALVPWETLRQRLRCSGPRCMHEVRSRAARSRPAPGADRGTALGWPIRPARRAP